MKKTVFGGVATALVTPADKYGNPDLKALKKLIEWQIDSGIHALVGCGTTGEASTLSEKEYEKTVEAGVSATAGKVPFIAGTGSNDIAHAIKKTKCAAALGADAALVVTPYYNKATQNGLVMSYFKIAEESPIPIILYNVPSRTGVGIEPKTYLKLSEHPNIVAIKEANGNISKIAETLALVEDRLDLYSGNDDQIVPVLSLGGKGVISVLSNILPKETVAMTDAFFKGDCKTAAKLQLKYLPLIGALFSEVNPIPVKAAISAMGYGENVLRLPLTEMEEGHKAVLFELMKKEGIQI